MTINLDFINGSQQSRGTYFGRMRIEFDDHRHLTSIQQIAINHNEKAMSHRLSHIQEKCKKYPVGAMTNLLKGRRVARLALIM
jgi:hypothetical protein